MYHEMVYTIGMALGLRWYHGYHRISTASTMASQRDAGVLHVGVCTAGHGYAEHALIHHVPWVVTHVVIDAMVHAMVHGVVTPGTSVVMSTGLCPWTSQYYYTSPHSTWCAVWPVLGDMWCTPWIHADGSILVC